MTIPTLGRRFAMGLTKGTATCWLVSSAAVLFAAGPCLGVYSRFTIIVEAYAAVVALSLVAYRSEIPGLGWLDARRLTRVGSASGSYYVLHMATLPAGMAVATLVIPAAWSAHAPGVVGVAVIAIWLVAIAPLMVCVFHLIEAPGIALGQRLIRCLGLDSRPQPHSDRSSLVVRQAA